MTTMQRIAEAMGCVPADDDDLVEAVRLLVSERDAAVTAERARCAAVCREVAAATRADGGNPYDGRAEVADECAEAIERGAVER